jgi:hypothetical protein
MKKQLQQMGTELQEIMIYQSPPELGALWTEVNVMMQRMGAEQKILIVSQMKIKGFVPRFDIEPDFTIDYNEKKHYFEFELSIYGIYIGRKQTECIMGIDGNRVIYTPPNRLSESLTAQA